MSHTFEYIMEEIFIFMQIISNDYMIIGKLFKHNTVTWKMCREMFCLLLKMLNNNK